MSRYHHLSPAYNGDDTDEHKRWFLAQSDLDLLIHAIHRLPPHMLKAFAGATRAYYQHNELGELLADTRKAFEDDMRTRNEL